MKLLETHEDFSDVLLIQQARVPIIKFVLNGIQFDVLFAAIEDPKRLGNLLKKLTNLGANHVEGFKDLSETTQSSLFGKIACQNILRSVPNKSTFKIALRAVRFWAMQRGLYNVNCGYFCGITLAVMVGKICQENPDLDVACLLYKFFEQYAESGWREPV